MSVSSYYGLGHRKEAVARVYLSPGSGVAKIFTGNSENRVKRSPEGYFPGDFLVRDMLYPLSLTGNLQKFDVNVYVSGGGVTAQVGAARLAIAKALLEFDKELRSVFRTYGLLTQDIRSKERKKVGKRGARRSPQFTKR